MVLTKGPNVRHKIHCIITITTWCSTSRFIQASIA